MSTALITGITGQTGSYLAQRLAASDWNIVGLVRAGDSSSDVITERNPEITLVQGDLVDAPALQRLVHETQPDAIFNLGGLTSVGQSWREPLEVATVTGLSVATLLDAALEMQRASNKPVTFVQASSAEMFGSPSVSPQDENTPVSPTNPYGAAKAYGHFLVRAYRELGLRASSCILYNHESPRRPTTFVTRKITNAVARIALGKQDRLVLGSLDARRDWGWAPDYADAIALVAGGEPDDFVVATGEAHSVEDFVVAAFSAAGIDDWRSLVEQDPELMRPADAAELVGDARRIGERLGWRPTVDFAEIVARMVANDLEIEAGAVEPNE